MGIGWFVGAIFLLSLATYLMAFFIHDVMRFFTWPPPLPREPLLESDRKKAHKIKTTFWEDKDDIPAPPVTEPKAPPNIWRYLSEFRESLRKPQVEVAGDGEEKRPLAESVPMQPVRRPFSPLTPDPAHDAAQVEPDKEPDVQQVDAQPEAAPGVLERVRRIRFARSRRSANSATSIIGMDP